MRTLLVGALLLQLDRLGGPSTTMVGMAEEGKTAGERRVEEKEEQGDVDS